MKSPCQVDRTKVVLRHLPPTISRSDLVEHVDSCFSGRYHWLSFSPGKSSRKHMKYSRAYINFNKPEDVNEFAKFFDGHVFVNKKGTQFKAIVEYAPSQRVPMKWPKKDCREGTLLKDPEYLEFLEFLAKPVENLPSAEIQLQGKEAERAGAPRDVPIITPLMEYVRQKRAAMVGARRTMFGMRARGVGGNLSTNTVSGSLERGSQKRASTSKYVLRDRSKTASSKGKSTYLPVPKQEDQHLVDGSIIFAAVPGNKAFKGETGGSDSTEKILLLKGKEKVISKVILQQNAANPAKVSYNPVLPKPNHLSAASGDIIRSILLNRDVYQNKPSSVSQSEPRIQCSIQDRVKKPSQHPNMHSYQTNTYGAPEDKLVSNDLCAVYVEKQERRTRNNDRPDRGPWIPRHSKGSHATDESFSLSFSQTSQVVDTAEEMNYEALIPHGGGYRPIRSTRHSFSSVDKGSYRHASHHASACNTKDANGSSVVKRKPAKRGGSSGHGSHEKQVWIQKSNSGT